MSQTKSARRWLVVAGSMVIGLFGGLIYAWSIFVKPVCAAYGWETNQVVLMGNVMMACFSGGTFLGGLVWPRYGVTRTGVLGAVLFSGAVICAAYAPSPLAMYLSWGVAGGFGIGMLYSVGMYAGSAWFPEKRGTVMSLFLMCFGLAPTVLAKPISVLLTALGVRRTMLYLGAFLFVVLGGISLFLMRLPPDHRQDPAGEKTPAALTPCSLREAVRTGTFWLFAGGIFCLTIPYAFINSYATVYAIDYRGLSADQAVLIVSASGLGAAGGRLLGGVAADRWGCRVSVTLACLSSAAACGLLLACRGFWGVLMGFVLVSVGFGLRAPVYGLWPVGRFGAETAGSVYGAASLAAIPSSLLAPMLTAATSYSVSTVCALAAAGLGLAAFWVTPRYTPLMRKNGIKRGN